MASTEDLVRRVEDVCGQQLTAKALRQHVLDLLRPVVPYDAHVFALTDPVTMVTTAPHADVPMVPWEKLPATIRWRYLTPVNRVDTLVGKPAASLLTATVDPAESEFWQQVQRDVGVVDAAVVVFADPYGVWAYLELWRLDGPFTTTELGLLTALVPDLTRALRASVARTFLDPADTDLPVGPAVVLLGADLAVRHQTEGAATTLLQLLPPDEPMPPIPAAAYNVGAALIAAEHGVPLGEPRSRIHLGGTSWVTAKASRLGEDIAVAIEPSTTAERMDLFARAAGLSGRETEVVTLLGQGLDTREIAGRLVLSEHTVNDHVKAVLAKTGARTRHVLMARLAGALG